MKSLRFSILFLTIALIANSCKVNPVSGKKEFNLLSDTKEQAMGDEYDPQVVAQFGVYQDQKMQAFIEEKGQAMAKISHRPNLNYEFKIMDSHVVNAFAVPGGYVYFTRGIMAHFNNEAEFAGVLGHEIGHITAKHSAKQYSKQMAAQVLLVGGSIISPKFRQYGEAASQGVALMFLKFSRNNESQSDGLGVDYSTAIGYDSHEMANFFQTIGRLSAASGQSVPDFMSTHPNPDGRYARVHQLSDAAQANIDKSKLDVNRNGYLRMIEGLVYGEDPRQGFVEDWMFYHPEMKFQFPVPNDWQYQNSPSQFQMAPKDGKSLLQLSLVQGTSLEEAKTSIITKFKLTEKSSKNRTVNGLSALEFSAEQPAQQEGGATTSLLITLYSYNGNIYSIMGVASTPDFASNERYFHSTMDNFRKLTDVAKINKKPERIRIKTVKQTQTLQQALSGYNTPANRLEELAILNGMLLSDQVKQGMLIKTIGL